MFVHASGAEWTSKDHGSTIVVAYGEVQAVWKTPSKYTCWCLRLEQIEQFWMQLLLIFHYSHTSGHWKVLLLQLIMEQIHVCYALFE